MRISLPQTSRIAATSWGEATTPRSPDSCARLASRTAVSSGVPAKPIRCSSASSRLVRTVTPSTRVDSIAQARSIAAPPEACTVTIAAPSDAASATACLAVFGMSWTLRSRKTFAPRAMTSRTIGGPFATKACNPSFKAPATPCNASARRRMSSREERSIATIRRSANRSVACIIVMIATA